MSSSASASPALSPPPPPPPPSNPAFTIDDDDYYHDASGNNRVDDDDDDDDDDDAADNANDGMTILDDGLSDFGDGLEDEEEGDGAIGRRRDHRRQLTSTEALLLKSESRSYRRLTSCAALATMLASVLVACGSYYLRWDGVSSSSSYDSQQQQGGGGGGATGGEGEGDDDDAVVSNGLGESENEGRLRRTIDYLAATDAVSDPRTLLHPGGTTTASASVAAFMSDPAHAPQYRAAVWLSQYDPARLEVPRELSGGGDGRVEYAFLQRYSLAVLYFSLGGPSGVNFLREWHECGWAYTYFDPYPTTYGAGCDGMPDYDGDDDAEGLDAERVVTQIYLPRE